MTLDRRLAALRQLASTQHGVVTRHQAEELGIDYRSQRRLITEGRIRLHLGSLLVPPSPVNRDASDAFAVSLRLDGRGTVPGPTALRLQGQEIPDQRLIAWCPLPFQPRTGSALRILRDDVEREKLTIGGLQVVNSVDALVDTLLTVEAPRAVELLDLALQKHWIAPASWWAVVEPRLGSGRRGATRLRALGRSLGEGTRSDGERRLVRILRRGRISGWVANWPLTTADGRILAELDIAFPELRLCIEVDGRAAHSGALQFEHDRRRQNMLVLQGWTVLRFTWQQIANEPAWVLAQIRAAVTALRAA